MFTLDAITGSQMVVLSGHTDWVRSVTFSSDGRSLASGSDDKTVKLWDLQTGGVIKTFYGHNDYICSVSISGDYTGVVSGSGDLTIHLWDIQTGECLHTIKQQNSVEYVCFSPTDPQHIILLSGQKVQEWDISSQQTSSLFDATSIAFSSDNTQLASCHGEVIVVQNFGSGAIIAQFDLVGEKIDHCCFSPDGKLLAAAAGATAYVWDIAGPDCCLIETFGHADHISALSFSSPSSLISASEDRPVKFWQIGTISKKQIPTDSNSALPTLSPIQSVSLQKTAGVAIPSDLDGVVKTWDLSTGLCEISIETPVGNCLWRDTWFIGSRLVIVWYKNSQIHTWDVNKNTPLWTVDSPLIDIKDLRISGDGSKVFCLTKASIQVWSIDTGEHMCEMVMGEYWYLDPLQLDGSRIWIRLRNLSTQGWDFGTSSSFLIPSFIGSAGRPLLDFTCGIYWCAEAPWIWDRISGKEVFRLSGRYANPRKAQWDGQYLITGYDSGELLILDFHHVSS